MQLTVDKLFEGVDLKQLQLLGRVHPGTGATKFCDYREFGGDAIGRAAVLGLGKGPSLQVLDVGAAFGYFIRVCHKLGHDAEGIDRSNPIYTDATALLGVAVHTHYVRAGEPLPEEIADYDLINVDGFGLPGREGVTRLDDVPSCDLWRDYVFFINDLLDRLRVKGRLAITLNFGRQWQNNLSDWRAAFGTRAEIDYSVNRIYLKVR